MSAAHDTRDIYKACVGMHIYNQNINIAYCIKNKPAAQAAGADPPPLKLHP